MADTARKLEKHGRPEELRFRTTEWWPGPFSGVVSGASTIGGGFLALVVFLVSSPPAIRTGYERGLLFALMALCWFVVVPVVQYLLMRRWTRVRPRFAPELSASSSPAFSYLSVRGGQFERNAFAILCSVPFLVAWVLLPSCAALFSSGLSPGTASAVGIAMGLSLYWLRYTVMTLRKPRGTLVEGLEQPGKLKFYEPL